MNLPSRSNTCSVIVTFNPDSTFVTNILQHLEIVDKIIIVDNNSDVDIEKILSKINLQSVEIIHSILNNGIAWALNVGIKRAKILSFSWILTFDQDSYPNKNILSYYSEVLKIEKKVGLIGTSFAPTEVEINKVTWTKNLTIITSGTLHSMEIIDKVNFYTEKLFIDNVDFDFSLRVALAGYKVIRINEPLLKHRLGTPIKKYGLTSYNHNLIRRYYYAKNNIYLTKSYWKVFPLWIIKKNFFFIRSIFILILVEDNVYEKLSSIFKGIKDEFKEY